MTGVRCLAATLVCGVTATTADAEPSVTLSTRSTAGSLHLDGDGSSTTRIVLVADVTATTLALLGYTLTIRSGALAKPEGATPIAFQVAVVGDGAAPPEASAFTAPSGSDYTYRTSLINVVPTNLDLYIKYTPRSLQDPGVYAATFALSVADN